MLADLTPIGMRQLNLFEQDDPHRQRMERLTSAMDALNLYHGRRVVTL